MVTEEERAKIAEMVDGLEENIVMFLQEIVRTPSINPSDEYEEIHSTVRSKFEDFEWNAKLSKRPKIYWKILD